MFTARRLDTKFYNIQGNVSIDLFGKYIISDNDKIKYLSLKIIYDRK